MKLTINSEIKLPTLPNFLKIENGNYTFDVADLSDEELEKLGREWTNALIQHAHIRRKN